MNHKLLMIAPAITAIFALNACKKNNSDTGNAAAGELLNGSVS